MNDKHVRAFDITESQEGHFTGYASVFGVVDSWGTVFDRGAFKKTIKDHKGRFPILRMHDPAAPIGIATVEEDDKGLRVTDGALDLDVQPARDVYSGMKKGYITQMSHRFHPIREKSLDGSTHLQEVRLLEVSAVTMNFASNDEANILTVRSETRGVVSGMLPLADADTPWDAGEANQRVQAWAKDENDEIDVAKYRRAFLWVDGDGENLTDYKFPVGDIVGGMLKAVPRAIYAAAARINQAQGVDRNAVKARLAAYYEKMGEKAPWERTILTVPSGIFSDVERITRTLAGTTVAAGTSRNRTPGDHLRTLETEIQRLGKALKGV